MNNKQITIQNLEVLLKESIKNHGHLCPGQVLGIRMAILGLNIINIKDPKGKDKKSLIVFVESDRCLTDAIQSVTGCSLGRRTLKFFDYGKVAATFYNIPQNNAIRIIAKEEAKEKAKGYFPSIVDKYKAQTEAYKIMPNEELFETMTVKVKLKPEDMPGKPLKQVKCSACGEYIQDSRETLISESNFCKPCSEGSYYILQQTEKTFFSDTVVHNSQNELIVKSKLWLEIKGEPIFGRGRKQLLLAIAKYGSINKAAKEIQISYKKAWSYITSMEERLGVKLVDRYVGGKDGGGAVLTNEAKEFLRKYEDLEEGINELVNRKFWRIFNV
ncbi:MAG: FmdE family protein [Thermodesulfovibrionales bacterium]|nr:FmdE family protein [Thermodesulfovibrionales bacterium]